MSSQQKTPMSEEKRKRIVVAMTAAGVFLLVFLVIILVIQFAQIGVRNSTEKKYKDQLKQYEELIEKGEKDLEYFQTEDALYSLALEHGWKSPGN